VLRIATPTTIDSTTAAIIDSIATAQTEMDRQTNSLRGLHLQIETQTLAITTIQLIG